MAGKDASNLVVLLDGKPLAEDSARALWTRFSAHMDQHEGDLIGFAKSEGFASVRPETRNGKAVLLVSKKTTAR